MKSNNFVYTGCDNLEAMLEAKNYNRYLINIIKSNLKNKNQKILDFGAGSGTYADLLKDSGIKVDCLEPDRKLQIVLRKKGYKVVSPEDLKPNTYDVIYALNVFEHIYDDNKEFTILKNSLKRNGIIIIYVPAFQILFSPMDKLVGHHRRYKKSHLKDMAYKNSMSIIKLKYCDPIGYFAALVYKMKGDKTGRISSGSVKVYDRFAFPVSKNIEAVFNKFGKNVLLVAQNNDS